MPRLMRLHALFFRFAFPFGVLALSGAVALAVPAGAQGLPDWAAPAAPSPAAPLEAGPGAPPPPPPPPPVPVDGGLGLLALAGAGYAARRLRHAKAAP